MAGHPPWHPVLVPGLAVVFVGFNPSPKAAETGHYYASPRNRFWELLWTSGLLPEPLRPEDDRRLPDFGYGLTDLVPRATPSSGELSAAELARGAEEVRTRLRAFGPALAAYTGKGVYRAVARREPEGYGEAAPPTVPGVRDFVLPSPSGRSGLPWAEKLRWYRALAGEAAAVRAAVPGPPETAP